MADSRPFAKLYRAVWRDPEFIGLDGGPQHLFFLLLTQPNITLAGTLPLQYTRWSRLTHGSTPETLRADIAVLAERCFVVVDEDTEELLVRTLMKNDTLWNKSPKTQLGVLRHCLQITSPLIRSALADEVERCLSMFVSTESADVKVQAREAVTELREVCIDTCIEVCIEANSRQQTADRKQQTPDPRPQTADLKPFQDVALGRGSGGTKKNCTDSDDAASAVKDAQAALRAAYPDQFGEEPRNAASLDRRQTLHRVTCEFCGREFDAKDPRTKFCNDAHKQAEYRRRRQS